MNKRSAALYLSIILGLALVVGGWYLVAFLTYNSSAPFDGARAYADVQTQVDMGSRAPGADGHAQIQNWLRAELESAQWTVDVHETTRLNHPIYNLIAKRGTESPQIILAAHYDTRAFADNDPDPALHFTPVLGANDGASGAAVLLELARTLPKDSVPVWLVFFDAEDQGRIEGWDWILGSRAFAEEISVKPQAVVVVDMVGDADLNLYYEKNSDAKIRAEIWSTAAELGWQLQFIPDEKYSMLDDHTPFLEKGIPAVDIIDFDYPYWHTAQDTPDKVSAESLQAVGETLLRWIAKQKSK
ncbi:MAG: M28 family peptidase [Anaerolineales bacterium]|nr:M28 family peptidase [Anaerolineales bacterium]